MRTQGEMRRLLRLAEVLETAVMLGDDSQAGYVEPSGPGLDLDGLDGPSYFNMAVLEEVVECGTVCCALGLGAILEGVKGRNRADFNHFAWASGAYGLDGCEDDRWLFDSDWAWHPDPDARGPIAAAHRIYYHLICGAHPDGFKVDWAAFVMKHPFEETKAAAVAVVSALIRV